VVFEVLLSEFSPFKPSSNKHFYSVLFLLCLSMFRRCAVDDVGLLKNFVLPVPPTTQALLQSFCCEKHQREAHQSQENFVSLQRQRNASDLKVAISKVDVYKNGFVSREILRCIAKDQLSKSKHDSRMSEEEFEGYLDQCVMTVAEQLRRRQWAGEKERKSCLGTVPIVLYDIHRFVNLFVDVIEIKDRSRIGFSVS
jgi:hypothetical protein